MYPKAIYIPYSDTSFLSGRITLKQFFFQPYMDFLLCSKRKKAKIRNQYNQVPHLTQDTEWGNGKNTRRHHKQEIQEVSHLPTGYHKAARNRNYSMVKKKTSNKKIHK